MTITTAPMKRTMHAVGIAVSACAVWTAPAFAQDSVKIELKQLAPAEARSTRAVSTISSLRGLPDGSVFINDNQRRQIVRFDGSLKNEQVVADTGSGAPIPYGSRQMGMLPYLGDSTILVDPGTSALLVLDNRGRLARIMAPPRYNDINTLASMNLGSNAFDTKGQLVYREGSVGGGPNIAQMLGSGGGAPSGGDRGGRGGGMTGQARGGGPPGQSRGGGEQPQTRGAGGGFPGGGRGGSNGRTSPDSIPVVRANFDTRKTDSVAWIKVPKTETSMTRGDDGSTRIASKINPLPQGDDWVLMSDGTVAVIRVLDYHVDWYNVDGTHTASERLPFDWKRITDDEKTRMVDSLNVLAKAASERMAAGGNSNFRISFEVVDAAKLPDYYPPVRAGASMADHNGNLWILPTTSNLQAQLAAQQNTSGGGRGGFGGGRGGPPSATGDSAARATAPATPLSPPAVYDVVNRKGELTYRVQVPAGRQLVGFGPDGSVYLSVREGRELFLEKTRIVQ